MKKTLFTLLASIFLYATFSFSAFANTNPNVNFSPKWGKNGHRIVGEIAQRYLSKKAKKNLKELVNKSRAQVAMLKNAELENKKAAKGKTKKQRTKFCT